MKLKLEEAFSDLGDNVEKALSNYFLEILNLDSSELDKTTDYVKELMNSESKIIDFDKYTDLTSSLADYDEDEKDDIKKVKQEKIILDVLYDILISKKKEWNDFTKKYLNDNNLNRKFSSLTTEIEKRRNEIKHISESVKSIEISNYEIANKGYNSVININNNRDQLIDILEENNIKFLLDYNQIFVRVDAVKKTILENAMKKFKVKELPAKRNPIAKDLKSPKYAEKVLPDRTKLPSKEWKTSGAEKLKKAVSETKEDELMTKKVNEGILGLVGVTGIRRMQELAGMPAKKTVTEDESLLSLEDFDDDHDTDHTMSMSSKTSLNSPKVTTPLQPSKSKFTDHINDDDFDLNLDTDTHPDPDLTDMNVDDELPIDTDSTFDPTDSNINIDSDIDMGTGDLEQSEAAVSILSACDTIQNSIKDLKVSEFKQIVKRLQDLSTSARAMGVDFLPESRKVK